MFDKFESDQNQTESESGSVTVKMASESNLESVVLNELNLPRDVLSIFEGNNLQFNYNQINIYYQLLFQR